MAAMNHNRHLLHEQGQCVGSFIDLFARQRIDRYLELTFKQASAQVFGARIAPALRSA
jgi:hypothetical protein